MSDLDRGRIVGLLNQLGDENNETALAAAREASRLVREAGADWSDLLVPQHESTATEVDVERAAPAAASGDRSDVSRIVERLLVRKDTSDTLRGDLEEFRRQIAAGTLDRMDADYIRALAKRLGA